MSLPRANSLVNAPRSVTTTTDNISSSQTSPASSSNTFVNDDIDDVTNKQVLPVHTPTNTLNQTDDGNLNKNDDSVLEEKNEDENETDSANNGRIQSLIESVRASFDNWDLDGDRAITIEDIIHSIGPINTKDLSAMVQLFDVKTKNKIEFPEFLSASIRKLERVQKEHPEDIVTAMEQSLSRKRPNWRNLSSTTTEKTASKDSIPEVDFDEEERDS